PCFMQTECLVEGPSPTLEINVRFLHPMARDVGHLSSAQNEDAFQSVPELRVDDEIYQSWHEAVERNVRADGVSVRSLLSGFRNVPFCFAGHRTLEPIRDSEG